MQMDLLNWTPPRKVLAFPLAKRIGRIRSVAEKLSRKHGFMAETYWKQTVSTLRGQMERVGIPDDEIEAELRSFFFAVQEEMTRMGQVHHGHPGGAA